MQGLAEQTKQDFGKELINYSQEKDIRLSDQKFMIDEMDSTLRQLRARMDNMNVLLQHENVDIKQQRIIVDKS